MSGSNPGAAGRPQSSITEALTAAGITEDNLEEALLDAARTADDAWLNEVMVAGGLWIAVAARFKVEPVVVNGQATNELYVWTDFMRSRYRLTVTLDPEPETP